MQIYSDIKSRQLKLRAAQKFAATFSVLLPLFCHATGGNGFVPTDDNVLTPGTNVPTHLWKQVGACGNSAIQISPRWVLSANHSHCSVGTVFRRQDGASAVVDLVPSTQPGQSPLSNVDLHLARLATPLPYSGQFAQMVFDFPKDQNTPCTAGHVLMAGNGQVDGGHGRFQVGWSSASGDVSLLTTSFPPVSPDPRILGNAYSTTGDSGGGLFVFNSAMPNGALVGLMQSPAYGLHSSRNLFPAAVKAQIEAVLANSSLNPDGDSLTWIDGKTLPYPDVRPHPPRFSNEGGGNIDIKAVPEYGLAYAVGKKVLVRIPVPPSCGGLPPSEDYFYRIRTIREDAPQGTEPTVTTTSFKTRYLWLPYSFEPGKYRMTVTAVRMNLNGEFEESLAAQNVELNIADTPPQTLASVDVQWEWLEGEPNNPKLPWQVTLKGIPNTEGPTPEGFLWISGKRDIAFRTVGVGDSDPFIIKYDDFKDELKPGDVITVGASPYIGASVAPSFTTIRLVIPSSRP